MKLICKILIVYIFTLLAFPCQDSFGNSCSHSTEQRSDHHDEQNNNSCHNCSPLCTCNCCHANTLVTVDNYQAPVEFMALFIIPLYKESYFPEITLSIWQPPKLS
jgi:hypothetical protein